MTPARHVDSSGPRWLDDREQAAWRAFLDMQSGLLTQLNRDLQEHSELSTADFAVLVQLSEHPGGQLRVLELARALRWEKSRLSHQLNRMQRRELLDRSNCPVDRRGAFVVLTATGRAALECAAPTHVESVRRYLFDGLSPEQVETWAAVSRHVVEQLAQVDPVADTGCGSGAAEPDAWAVNCGAEAPSGATGR